MDSVAEARKLLRSLPSSLAQDTEEGWLHVGRLLHSVGHSSASAPSLTVDLERDWIEWSLKGREKLPLPGTITITPGSSVVETSADLTPHIKRGDRVRLLLSKEQSDAMGLERSCVFRVAYAGTLTPTRVMLDSKQFAPIASREATEVTTTTAELVSACTRKECEAEWKAMYVQCEGEEGSGRRGLGNSEDAERLQTAWRFIQSEKRRARELESGSVEASGIVSAADSKALTAAKGAAMASKARENAAAVEKQFREMCCREEIYFVEPNAGGRLVRSTVDTLEPPAAAAGTGTKTNAEPTNDKVVEQDAVEASLCVGDRFLPLAPGGSINGRWLAVLRIDAFFGRVRCRPVAAPGARGKGRGGGSGTSGNGEKSHDDDDGGGDDDEGLNDTVDDGHPHARPKGYSSGVDKPFWVYFERLNGALVSRQGLPRAHSDDNDGGDDDDDDDASIGNRGIGGWAGPLASAALTFFRLPFEDHRSAMASLRVLSGEATAEAKAAKAEGRVRSAVKRFAVAVKKRARRCNENGAMAIAVLRRLQPHRAADYALWSDVGSLLRQATEALPSADGAIVEPLPRAKEEAAFEQRRKALEIMEKASALQNKQGNRDDDNDNDDEAEESSGFASFGFDAPLQEYKVWSKRSSKWEELRQLGYEEREFDDMCERRWLEYEVAAVGGQEGASSAAHGVDSVANLIIEGAGGEAKNPGKGSGDGKDDAEFWEQALERLEKASKLEADFQRKAVVALAQMMAEDNRFAPVTAATLASTCGTCFAFNPCI